MSVDVTKLDLEEDQDEWNRYVERSTDTNPFYRAEALRLQAAETDSTVHALAGFKGQEAVGLFPVFERRTGPFTAVFSPAPYSWTIYLGPAMVNLEALKRRKVDRRTRTFLENCIEWIDDELSPVYHKYAVTEFPDTRPFVWNDFTVEPNYTYVLDLDRSESELLDRFSADARRNVTNADPSKYLLEEGDRRDVCRIVEQVQSRYDAQDRPFHLTTEFAQDLYETLPIGSIRPYTCRIDGEFMGGILVLDSDVTRYRWQGGVRPDTDVDLSINDLLDWYVIRTALADGFDHYDFVGAGVPSINRYKAKFNPRLVTNYTVTGGVYGLDILIDTYRKMW